MYLGNGKVQIIRCSMDKNNSVKKIFKILEIEETTDTDAIKAAYRRKLVNTNPEDDPEGFVALRKAYEDAVAYAKEGPKEEEKDEIDLFVDRAKTIYSSMSKRIDPKNWEELLEDDLCAALDTEELVGEKLMVLFMECCNLPGRVWKVLDKKFHYTDNVNKLKEKFPVNFVDYVVNQIKNDDFVDYDLFYGPDDADYDDVIELIFRLREMLDGVFDEESDAQVSDEAKAVFDEIEKAKAGHPFLLTMKMLACMKLGQMDEAADLAAHLENGFGQMSGKDYMDNPFIKISVSRFYKKQGDVQKAFELRRQMRDAGQDSRMLMIDDMEYYYERGEYKKAKEASLDFLEKYGNTQQALDCLRQSNSALIDELKEGVSKGDIDSYYELGWCYFQNEDFAGCRRFIEDNEKLLREEREFEYYNLYGRCLAAMGEYFIAGKVLKRWQEMLYALADDGSDLYKKRIKRKGYSHYMLGMCNYSIWNEDKTKQSEYDEAIKNFKMAIDEETNLNEKYYFMDRLAMAYIDGENYPECVKVCDEILEAVPYYYSAYIYRQEANYKMGNLVAVCEDFYTAIRYYDKDIKTYEYAAKAFLEGGRTSDAVKICDMVKENQMWNDTFELLKIKTDWKSTGEDDEYKNSKLNACISRLYTMKERIIDKEWETTMEDVSEITYTMAMIYFDMDKKKDAFRCLQKTIEINGDRAQEVYWTLADKYMMSNDYANELKALKKIKKLGDSDSELYYRLGRCYWYMDENTKAKESFEKVYKINPQHYVVNAYLSDYYMYMYRETLDREYVNKALTHAKNQYAINDALYYLVKIGQIYWEVYDIENVKKIFTHVLEEDECCMDAYYYLARVAALDWDYDKAYELLLKGYENGYSTILLNEYVVLRRMIDVCLATERFDEAMKWLNAYEEKYPASRFAWRQRVRIYKRRGANAECLHKYYLYREENKAQNAPAEVIGNDSVNIAQLLYVTGDKNKAANEVRHAISVAKNNNQALFDVYSELIDTYTEIEYQPKTALKYIKKSIDMADDKTKMSLYLKAAYMCGCIGNKKKAAYYFDEFCKMMKKIYTSIERYYEDPTFYRAGIFNLGEYFYSVGDIKNLEVCIKKIESAKPCEECCYCACYELKLLKGFLEELKGNDERAFEYFEEANVITNHNTHTNGIVMRKNSNKGR